MSLPLMWSNHLQNFTNSSLICYQPIPQISSKSTSNFLSNPAAKQRYKNGSKHYPA